MHKSLLLLIVFASLFALAASEITGCGVISESGEYVLVNDLSVVSGECIRVIQPPKGLISIDCNHYKITGIKDATNAVHVNVDSFTLEGCTITGFEYGVFIDGSDDALVYNNTFSSQSQAAVHLAGSDSSNSSYNEITSSIAFNLLDSNDCVFQENLVEGASFALFEGSSNNVFSGGSFTSTELSDVDWSARLRHALMPGDDGSCVSSTCPIPPCPPVCACVDNYRDCSTNERAVNLSYYSSDNSFEGVLFDVDGGLGLVSVIQISSNSQGNSFTGCTFGPQALVQSHGENTEFSNCDFNAESGLDLYGANSKVINSNLGSQGIVFYGANGKAFGLDSGGFVAFKSQGGYLASSILGGADAYFLAPLPSTDEFARAEDSTVAKVNVSNARVTWLNGGFDDVVFQDSASRLKREWAVTLNFTDIDSYEPVFVSLSLADALGNSVYSSEASVSLLELNLTEEVLSSVPMELKGGRLRLSGFWDAGSYDPHSYTATADGYEDAFGEFSSGSEVTLPIVLIEAMGGPSPSITPSVSAPPLPSGMPGSFFTIQAPSSLVINPQVTVFVDLVEDGEGICQKDDLFLEVDLEGDESLPSVYSPDSCVGGRHVFSLELSSPGSYALFTYSNALGFEDYEAYSSLRVLGQPPQAVPDASLFTIALAGLLAFYALRRRRD